MANKQLRPVIHYLRRLVGPLDARGRTDAALLDRFFKERDEAAFAALVDRHGPMVWGVCRRILNDSHAAEDAFQATFLVLVRKGRSLAKPELLAHWIYGVACRTAARARADAAKRLAVERKVACRARLIYSDDPTWHDLQPLLDQEVQRLPERYRVPFVLCCLQDKTNEEVARLIGCPVGTVWSRLSRAREILRARLTRRGLALSAGLLASAFAKDAATAAVPTVLAEKAVEAALLFKAAQVAAGAAVAAPVVTLAKGVMRAMFLTKLLSAAVVVFAMGGVGTGTVLLMRPAGPANQGVALIEPPPEPDAGPPSPQPAQAGTGGAGGAGGGSGGQQAGEINRLLPRWEKRLKEKVAKDPKLKALAAKYPPILLYSRAFYAGGGYGQSAYSFIDETADEKEHLSGVQLLFDNGEHENTFEINMVTDQRNLVADLGPVDFTKDVDPKKVDIDAWSPKGDAVEGHVYLQRVRDKRGNNFHVLFQIVALDDDSRYMAFLWRRLPGGTVIRRPVRE